MIVAFEATVLDFDWRNPHVYFRIATVDESGERVEWEVESGSTPILRTAAGRRTRSSQAMLSISRCIRSLTLEVFLEDPEYLANSFSGTLNWDYVPDFEFHRYDCDPDVATRFSLP